MIHRLSFTLFFLAFFTVAADAQILLGGGPLYGDDIEELGVNLRAYTFINEKICFGPEFTLFGNHDTVIDNDPAVLGLWEINFNGHYIFEVEEGLGLYSVAGLNYSREKERIEGHDDLVKDAFGVNLGFGVHYEARSLIFYTEYDHLFSDLRQNSFTIGLLFHLGKKHTGREHD